MSLISHTWLMLSRGKDMSGIVRDKTTYTRVFLMKIDLFYAYYILE